MALMEHHHYRPVWIIGPSKAWRHFEDLTHPCVIQVRSPFHWRVLGILRGRYIQNLHSWGDVFFSKFSSSFSRCVVLNLFPMQAENQVQILFFTTQAHHSGPIRWIFFKKKKTKKTENSTTLGTSRLGIFSNHTSKSSSSADWVHT